MGEDLFAQVVHGFLGDFLHDANLNVLEGEAQCQGSHQEQRHPADASSSGVGGKFVAQRGHDVLVHGDLEELGADGGQRGDGQGQQSGHGHPSGVGAQVAEQTPRGAAVVEFS